MISNCYYFLFKLAVGVLFLTGMSSVSNAACDFENKQSVSFEFPSYSFYKIIGAAIEECGNVTAAYSNDSDVIALSQQSKVSKKVDLLGVSVSSLDAMQANKMLMPLDDLVEKYGKALHERQFIRRNGEIVAIAITANAQVMVVHDGLFKQAEIEPPKSYSSLFDITQKLTNSEAVKKPFSIAFKNGWSVANEFNNFLMSDGGQLLSSANQPAFNNAKGEAALSQMVALLGFIPDDFDKADAKLVQSHLARGEVAMGILWASSVAELDDPALSRVSGRIKMLPAPSVNGGGKPASTYWWDGLAISSSSSPQEAEAAFKVAMEGLDAEMLAANNDAAIWLMKDYVPNRLTQGVIDSIALGIPEYPASTAIDLLYKALGEEIPKFLKGEKGAAQTLIDAETAYSSAARERGLLN